MSCQGFIITFWFFMSRMAALRTPLMNAGLLPAL